MSATSPKISITANEETDPFDLSTVTSDTTFIFTGGTGGTVTPYYSNRRGTKVAADYIADPTAITIPAAGGSGPWQLPFGVAKFVKFVGAAVTGTVTIRPGPANDDKGNLIDIGGEYPPTPQVTA